MKIAEQVAIENSENSRNQAAEWEVIYRHAPVGLAVYDRNLRFVRVNDALAKFHSLAPAQPVGRRVEEVNPEFGKEIGKCLQEVFSSGEPVLNMESRRVMAGNPA